MSANPKSQLRTYSPGEEAFRNTWNNVHRPDMPKDVQIMHLKGSLESWVRSAVVRRLTVSNPEDAAHCGHEDVKLVLALVESYVSDAVADNWTIERLTAAICTTASAESGVQL